MKEGTENGLGVPKIVDPSASKGSNRTALINSTHIAVTYGRLKQQCKYLKRLLLEFDLSAGFPQFVVSEIGLEDAEAHKFRSCLRR